MLAAAFIEASVRAGLWTAMLIWMGAACLVNFRRCGRTHCLYTGPFFLLMAACVVAYAIDLLPLGPYGWAILGAVTVMGNALIWWGTERLVGRFRQTT